MMSCCVLLYCFFFFFKQKTAYEMRISDWSSDVCSSDLRAQLQMSKLEELVEQRTQAFKQASSLLQMEIDERKMLESQLVQSEKLASLGQLAAGVAHEINNPISFISSNLGALAGYFGKLQEMLQAYDRDRKRVG